jgi:hypothetical protein
MEERLTTAALLGGRVLDCCVKEGWDYCCPAKWERTTLLARREMDDGCAAGWKDGMTATLLSWRESDLLLGGRRAKTVDELVYS